MLRRLLRYLDEWRWRMPTRCYMCRRWFPRNSFWNPWLGRRLTLGLVHRLHAEGKLTPAQSAAASIAVQRGHHGLCCSEDCCEAARTGSTDG